MRAEAFFIPTFPSPRIKNKLIEFNNVMFSQP